MVLAGCFESGMIIKYLLGTQGLDEGLPTGTAHIRNYNSPTSSLVALNSDKPFQNKPTSVPREVLVNTVLLRWFSVSVFLHFSDQSRILN